VNKVVISQPMFFPWIGIFEQIRLADVFVHFDNVFIPQGRSFVSRVKIKTHHGSQWLSLPVMRGGMGQQLISDVRLDEKSHWKDSHLKTLRMEYSKAPFRDEMLALVEDVYNLKTGFCSELNKYAIEKISEYFSLDCFFKSSSDIYPAGLTLSESNGKSEKLIFLMQELKGEVYITGHGGLHYLNHDLFEKNQIRVEYMDYLRTDYSQLHVPFDPHVSVLDLIANRGRDGKAYIHSPSVYWKNFIPRGQERPASEIKGKTIG
jgi:hypothetical protein